MAERHSGRPVMILYCNGGGEYTRTEFQNYLTGCEVKQFKTNAYKLLKNGVAEGVNRTLLNMVP